MIKNQIKTFLLLVLLSAIVLAIGSLFGKGGLLIAFIFVLFMNGFSYYFSDKIVLALYRAKPLTKQHWLYHETSKLARKARLPMPKLYVSNFPIANAFATGRDPNHSTVVVTNKLLNMLNKEEILGVISHELSHIKNRDILISTIASVLAGIIMYTAAMLRWGLIFGYDDRDNWFSLIVLAVIAIIAPIAALLIQLAISRSREFLADETGARLLGNGKPLARALLKLEKQAKIPPAKALGFEATENLFIVNPFSKKGLVSLFSTHPPVEERVKRLLKI